MRAPNATVIFAPRLTLCKADAMVVRMTLLAVCLALALPAPAVFAQDDCEELDCENNEEAASSAEADPDDSSGEDAEEASADDAEFEEESEESDASDAAQEPDEQSDSATDSDDAAVDDDLSEAEADLTELAPDETALAAGNDAEDATPAEEPSEETPLDPPAEPASPQSPAEPAPAAPAAPTVDAAALQAFQERRENCFLGQPIQGPPEHDRSQNPDLEKGLYCARQNEGQSNGPQLPITSHTALFSILGVRFGGDGKQNFALPALPQGYCICLQGRYPRRDEPDELGPILKELCRLEATVSSFRSCPELLPQG